jgi:hypothetical protein
LISSRHNLKIGLQSGGRNDATIEGLVVGLSEENVIADGGVDDPSLLRNVGNRPIDLVLAIYEWNFGNDS